MNLNNKILSSIICFFCLIFFLLLSGCSTTNTVKVDLRASSHLNQDTDGNALPVMVRLYALNSDEQFSDATFHQLWQDDKRVLSDTLTGREELMVNPDSHNTVKLSYSKDTQFIAAVAIFRRPEDGHWRLIKSMPGAISQTFRNVHIVLTNNSMKFD